MSTHTQLLFHIVFATKNREKTIVYEQKQQLYAYIWGVLKNNNCHLYRMNGVEDHIHILTHIHPTISVSNLVKNIKVASSMWIKEQSLLPNFTSWQEGYGAFSCSYKDKDRLIDYIKNQEQHHKKFSFEDEYKALLEEHGIKFDEKYLF